jgi:hydroxyacylglutathione hydrolase
MFEILLIPAFKDNYIWLLTRGSRAFVVDPGDAAPVLARLAADDLVLEGILITHHHADHQGGVAELLARYPAAVFAPVNESITGCTQPLSGGERIDVLGTSVEVMAVPGHTLGHLAYHAPGALFCGDTLFAAGCGRLFEGTPEQMSASLDQIADLPDETLIYCAHEYTEANLRFALAVEPENEALQQRVVKVAALRAAGQSSVPSTLAEEKATNPFLRCTEPAVIAAGLRQSGFQAASASATPQGGFQRGAVHHEKSAIFAMIRSWRNTF